MLYRVLGYDVRVGHPVKAMLILCVPGVGLNAAAITTTVADQQQKQQPPPYVVVSSRRVYDDKTMSLRQFFSSCIVPKRFIDIVTIEDNKKKKTAASSSAAVVEVLPIRIVEQQQQFCHRDIQNLEPLVSYQLPDVFEFFPGLDEDINDVIPAFDSQNQPNEGLFTCEHKMTEEQFVHKFIHFRNQHFIKRTLINRFLAQYNKMSNDSMVPSHPRYFHLYWDDGDPFQRLNATLACREIVYKKVFKYMVSKLCRYMTVSLTREDHVHAVGLSCCLAVPSQPKLEYINTSTEPYACYTHTMSSEGLRQRATTTDKHLQPVLGEASNELVLMCRTAEAYAFGQLQAGIGGGGGCEGSSSDYHKKNKALRKLRYTPYEQPLINVSLVMVCSRNKYFLCYDSTRAVIICHGSNLQHIMEHQLLNMNVVFHGTAAEYSKYVLVANRRSPLIPRSFGPKPKGYSIMKEVCYWHGKQQPLVPGSSDNGIWYKKGSVVCEATKDTSYEEGATCFDFNNYYGTILILNVHSIQDWHLARTVRLMTDWRTTCNCPAIKLDIVALLGLCKHYDPATYHLIKMEGVNNCLATIDLNSSSNSSSNDEKKKQVINVTTDGIAFKGQWESLRLPDPRYPYKKEYCFQPHCFYATSNQYFGFNVENDDDDGGDRQFILKGLTGRNNFPVVKQFVKTFVRLVVEKYSSSSSSSSKKKITNDFIVEQLIPYLMPSEDYLLMTDPAANKDLRYPAEYAYSELCQDRYLCLAKPLGIGDEMTANSYILMGSVHKKKNLQIVDNFFNKGLIHVNCVYAIHTEGYIDLFRTKLDSCCKMLYKAYPSRKGSIASLVNKLNRTVVHHLHHNMDTAQKGTMVPGALFDLSSPSSSSSP